MASFGKNGRFMQDALNTFSSQDLQNFFNSLGVKTHVPDGFRVFPYSHNSQTVIDALQKELRRLNVRVLNSCKIEKIITKNGKAIGVSSSNGEFFANNIIIATGGKGYPTLGAEGDGYILAQDLGHKITPPHPAMMPLKTKEQWVANCRADTVANVLMQVDIKKYKKLKAIGDLIFTKDGIRGPVVLDFSREITPLLAKMVEVPILINLTKGKNQEQIRAHLKQAQQQNPNFDTLELVASLLPKSIAKELIKLVLPFDLEFFR